MNNTKLSHQKQSKLRFLTNLDRQTASQMPRHISQSRSRLLGLEGGVKTKWRFLNLDRDFSIVETSFLKLLKFCPTVKTYFLPVSRHIKTPRIRFKALVLSRQPWNTIDLKRRCLVSLFLLRKTNLTFWKKLKITKLFHKHFIWNISLTFGNKSHLNYN